MASLQQYLQRHQYNSTTSEDLWKEFDSVTGLGVTEMMRSWTFQGGIPRVQVLTDSQNSNQLKIYQVSYAVSQVCRDS